MTDQKDQTKPKLTSIYWWRDRVRTNYPNFPETEKDEDEADELFFPDSRIRKPEDEPLEIPGVDWVK